MKGLAIEMKKCIYTLNDDTKATFKSREHIIPRSIGGIRTLDREWVCDDFNNYISKAEREFARQYPLIILPRMISALSGRKEHTGKVGIGFFSISVDPDQLQLGYIAEGTPHVIPQIFVSITGLNRDCLDEFSCVVEQKGEEQHIISNLLEYHGKRILIETDNESFKDSLVLGYINRQVYVGIYSGEKMRAEEYADKLINLMSNVKLKIEHHKHTEGEYKTIYQGKTRFCIEEVNRIYAKIAFNILAYIKGQSFVLKAEFDTIRQAIVTGVGILEYVSSPLVEGTKPVNQILQLNNEEHLVLLYREGKILCGAINLFGDTNGTVIIKLSTNWTELFNTTGYICDWKNRMEYTLEEYLENRYASIK